jgi:fatty acid/phospholipid biosynthesis enzyme
MEARLDFKVPANVMVKVDNSSGDVSISGVSASNHKIESSSDQINQKNSVFDSLKKAVENFDFTRYGGAVLLGVKGLCSICHGSSSPIAVKNAIFQTQEFFDMNLAKEFEKKCSDRFKANKLSKE